MSETFHTPLSASGSKLWLNCAGSVNAQKDLPNPDNEFSLYGSAAHALAETCLVHKENAIVFKGGNAVKKNAKSDFVILDGEANDEDFYKVIPVDDEMMAGVQTYLDFCRNLEGEQEWVERRVHFGEYVPGNSGTADYIKVATHKDFHLINVADLKFGKGVRVYAENNSQAKLYGLGVVNDLDFLYDFHDTDVVNIIIVQPRLDHIDQWQITVGELRNWAEGIVKPAATLAQTEDAPRVAGTHCTDGFCRRGKAGCKTLTAFNASLIQGDFTNVEEMVKKPFLDPKNLTNKEIGLILPLLPGMYKWGKHLEAHAYDEIMAGRKIFDYKPVQGKPGNRFFKDPDEMMKWVLKMKLVKKKGDLVDVKVKSPPQIEKAIKANGKKSDGLEDFWTKPEGKITIAHVSDKRPEVDLTPDDDDFNDVTLGDQ